MPGKLALWKPSRPLGETVRCTPPRNASGTFTGVLSNVISGTGTAILNINKVGTGTQTLGGANTYSGSTTVTLGKLQLGAANAIPSGSPLILVGGTFASAGFSDNFGAGTLTISANSSIDFGGGASILRFAASNAIPWAGSLTIDNWTGSLTGGGTDENPVGTAFVGLAHAGGCEVVRWGWLGTRYEIMSRTAKLALNAVRLKLSETPA